MANVLIVDNFTLPTPDKMEYKEADLQWSGWRDAAGFLHKTTVRYGVRTIKVTYERTLYNEDITLIRNALTGPAERGDADTVRKHLECLSHRDNEEDIKLYASATRQAVAMAQRRHPERDFKELEQLLINY